MRSDRVWALLMLSLSGCPTGTTAKQYQYACKQSADCVSGFVCSAGVCVPACNANLLTDPQNCGGCGIVCPTPVHSTVQCRDGGCGRSPCASGYFDLDGPAVFGCESTCAGGTCTLGDGGTVLISTPPLPETGVVFHVLASGSSYGGFVQTSPSYTNIGVEGEPTPPGVDGGVLQTNGRYINVGGFSSIQRSP